MDGDFCPVVGDSFPLRVNFSLVEEMEDSSRFPLALNYFSLSNEVVFKLLALTEGVEGI